MPASPGYSDTVLDGMLCTALYTDPKSGKRFPARVSILELPDDKPHLAHVSFIDYGLYAVCFFVKRRPWKGEGGRGCLVLMLVF